MNGRCPHLLRQEVRDIGFTFFMYFMHNDSGRYEVCLVARREKRRWDQVILHGRLGVVCKGQFSPGTITEKS